MSGIRSNVPRPPRSRKPRGSKTVITFTLAAALVAPGAADAKRKLSLRDAVKLALKNNPTLEVLAARVSQAEAAQRKSWSAIKPTASAVGTYTHNQLEIIFNTPRNVAGLQSLPDTVVIQQNNQLSFDLNAKVPLFHGAAYHRIRAAQRATDGARLQRLRSRDGFILRVAKVYYQAIARTEAVRALENKIKLDENNLRAARERLEVGQTPRSDVLRAELVLTQDKQSLTRLSARLQANEQNIAILCGVKDEISVVPPREAPAPSGPLTTQVARAQRTRPDLRASRVAVDAANKTKTAVWWSFFPLLDFSFLYRWTQAPAFANQNGQYRLLLTLTMPLYDAGKRYAELKKADAEIAQQVAERRVLEQRIRRQLVTQRAALAAAEANLLSATKARALAQRTARDVETRYEAGAASQLEVLDVNQRQLSAELSVTRSRYERDLARLKLAHAMGELARSLGVSKEGS